MTRDLAIDLGTSMTRVYVVGKGIILREPSLILVNNQNKNVLAFGSEAREEVGKFPGYNVIMEPLQGGAVTDFEVTERMIEIILAKSGVRRLQKPRVVISVASSTTEVERRALREATKEAGAGRVVLIEQCFAGALGADLPINEPVASMIVDVGAGTTEAAIFALGGVVNSETARIGGNDIDSAIQSYLRREYSLAISKATAEEVKISISSAYVNDDEIIAEITGRDVMSGEPDSVRIKRSEINIAISELVASIISTVRRCLSQAPPDLGQDLIANGIYISGGGSKLRFLGERIANETMLPVELVENPLDNVVLGSVKSIEFFDEIEEPKPRRARN